MLLPLLLLAAPAPPPEIPARAAELATRARAHHDAREYVQAADAYFALSSLPGVDVDDALGRAHLDLEAAFASTQQVSHLCRALQLARGRLARAADDDEQKRQRLLFWEETVAEDLEHLAEAGGEEDAGLPEALDAVEAEALGVGEDRGEGGGLVEEARDLQVAGEVATDVRGELALGHVADRVDARADLGEAAGELVHLGRVAR